jgi:hypothetical protein
MPATTFTASDLAHFFGSDTLYNMPLFGGWRYTEGVKFLNHNGCGWLVTDILAVLKSVKKVRNESFVSITLKVGADKTASVVYTDGDNGVLFRQEYAATDCPVSEIKFFAVDNVLMLTSEY